MKNEGCLFSLYLPHSFCYFNVHIDAHRSIVQHLLKLFTNVTIDCRVCVQHCEQAAAAASTTPTANAAATAIVKDVLYPAFR
jgi:hypothetical protein